MYSNKNYISNMKKQSDKKQNNTAHRIISLAITTIRLIKLFVELLY
jgi:hypothetical protein